MNGDGSTVSGAEAPTHGFEVADTIRPSESRNRCSVVMNRGRYLRPSASAKFPLDVPRTYPCDEEKPPSIPLFMSPFAHYMNHPGRATTAPKWGSNLEYPIDVLGTDFPLIDSRGETNIPRECAVSKV